MANRNVTPNFTLEQWRVEFNELSDDLGDFNSGITGSIPASIPTYLTAQSAVEGLIQDINRIMDGTYQFTGDMYFDANVSIVGNLTIGGDITIGDQTTDSITVAADFESDLIPESGGTYNLGSSISRWANIYIGSEATLASAVIEDLTDGKVVITGTGGSLEESQYLTFDGSTLTTQNISVTNQASLASASVSDLTSGRIVLSGLNGELEDNSSLTFDGSILTLTGNLDLNGELDVSSSVIFQDELNVAGNVYLTNTTESSSSTSGTLVVSGGVGIAEDLYVGGNIFSTGTVSQIGGDPYTTQGFSIAVAIALG